MKVKDQFGDIVGNGYWGRILKDDYSREIKRRVAEYISLGRSFEKIGHPAIFYISAWREDEKIIWYEFASRRFSSLLDCEEGELASAFRESVLEHRVYGYGGVQGSVTEKILGREELRFSREGLREEGEKGGVVEAVYKIPVRGGDLIWLKDQAVIETYDEDGIKLSLGCLTDVSKEMEAEEALKRAEAELQKANGALKRLAALDGLTQVANRRSFDERLNQEWLRMKRDESFLSLIMCDIDFFKRFNDTYGHQKGDDCLKAVAGAIERSVRRPADMVARYGGEEFAVILPDTESDGAGLVAEGIRREVRGLAIAHSESEASGHVTLSLGVSSVVPHQDQFPENLIESADRALYEAKEKGRNRVVVKGMEDPQ